MSTNRLLPEEPLPPYTFVPGRCPHPESDPAGHSYGQHRPTTCMLEPDNWRISRVYLRGLDLFNSGFYWESHVEFESLWIAADRRGVVAMFLKGLIKLAAAGVKQLEGVPEGVKNHSGRAADHWREVRQGMAGDEETFLGLELPALIELAETIHINGWPPRPPILLPRES